MKYELDRRWKKANDALGELANLCVWPEDKDIADAEGELLQELDEIEYQTGQEPT